MGKGIEEDRYLFIGRDGQFPEQFQAVKEAEGKEELDEVVTWWHGSGVAKIVAEVMGETIASMDMVWNVLLGYIPVEFKVEVVDMGEEHFDEVWEGQVGVVIVK